MNRTIQQSKAITAASLYLQMRGYTLIEQNWKRSKHHIDIIAKKSDTIQFIDIRYISDEQQKNNPIDPFTPSDLKALSDSALLWTEEEKWRGAYSVGRIEIGDPNFAVISFSDSIL